MAIVEIALAILVGLAFARVVWAFVAPLPVSESPPPPKAAAAAPADTTNLFRAIVSAEIETAPDTPLEAVETSLDLTLHGTWVEADGGTAIIRTPDGVQKSFSVGDAICCGATLERVYTGHVTISRGGARESLKLANKLSPPTPPAPVAPIEAPPPDGRRQLQSLVRLQPTKDAAGLIQFQLFPLEDEGAFERLGLRAGDVLIDLNGRPAPRSIADAAQLMKELEGATMVKATIERNGVRLPILISETPGRAASKFVE